jgi:2,4-dienoyl-CoA reductase-like NADH-dependent reductase (Old Yellow Enzyme family)
MKLVTQSVHAKGGATHVQIWGLGRANPGTDVPKVVSSGELLDASPVQRDVPSDKERL